MSAKSVRNLLCSLIVASVPFLSVAADGGSAMVHPYGAAWLNGAAVDHASVIFPGDLVQTSPDSVVKIEASGTSITVLSDSLVKFDGSSVTVERGGANLRSSTNMSVHAAIVTVTSASGAPSEFQVTHSAGAVQVVALKGGLQISNGSETRTLSQGQQATQIASDSDQTLAGAGVSFGTKKAVPLVIGAAKVSEPTRLAPIKDDDRRHPCKKHVSCEE